MDELAGSKAGAFCAQMAMRILGGYSYSVEYDIERYYRNAMLMCIGEGTNGVCGRSLRAVGGLVCDLTGLSWA